MPEPDFLRAIFSSCTAIAIMPKDRQKRTVGHASSIRRQFATSDSQRLADDFLARPSVQESTGLKKQDKVQLRREALLERLALTQSPYSKSRLRRTKRKAREQLASGLNDMQAALDSLDNSEPKNSTSAAQSGNAQTAQKTKPGQIGEGKGVPLSGQQRKRVLQAERMRHPLILTNPQFSSNPFQTIRTHAQNTLVKHALPES
ncbi:hypothetical protein L218DRAFT_992958 [Marasmius fiardii PR-910]|nr:hypothetical protein L218DRAFT_992958 [Marasmius fiardii PR-910]